MRVLVLAGVLLLTWHGRAAAQTESPDVFLHAYVGGQVHSHTFSTSGSSTVYGEPSTFNTSQGVSGGVMFDFGGAFLVNPVFAIGASVSIVSDTESASLTATIPHPIFFDRSVTVTGEQGELSRREVGVNIEAKVMIPTGTWLPENSWIAFVIGPSFFNLSQDLIASITIPTGSQSATPNVESQSGSGVGVNAGFEARFAAARNVGIGAFIRYAGGKVDLDAVPGMKVGGFQGGAGINLGF